MSHLDESDRVSPALARCQSGKRPLAGELPTYCLACLISTALLFGLVLAGTSAQAEGAASPPQPPPGATLGVPPPEVLLVLIGTTLVALNQAVHTGNFTVLRDLGSPVFQQSNTPAQLGLIFADLRNRNIDLSPVVIVTPQITESPQVTQEQLLRLVGYFPTNPLQIQFQILFQPVNGHWRLYGLAVNTTPATAAQGAPAATVPGKAKPASPAKKNGIASPGSRLAKP